MFAALAGPAAPIGKAPLLALLARFDGIARQAGVTMINEGTSYDAWLAGARKIAEGTK